MPPASPSGTTRSASTARGLLTTDDFRDFTFANAVRLWGGVNPRLFEGTAVEREAAVVRAAAESGSR